MSSRSFKLNITRNSLILIVIMHVAVTFSLHMILRYFGYMIPINNHNVLNWDASWYLSIKDNGYQFVADKMCNLAFFPLFPLVWKFLHFGPVFISIINNIIFSVCFYYLVRNEKLPSVFFLLILAMPSFIFFALPYSEAIFFLFSTLILKGYHRNSPWLKFVGFLGASFARSVSIVFLPAIILVELTAIRGSDSKIKSVLSATVSVFGCLAGVLITALIQGFQTGKWFYFLEVQKFWFRNWTLPKLPLTTLNERGIIGIDTVALAIGIMAVCCCMIWAYRFLFQNRILSSTNPVSESVLFSSFYLSATVILDTFFTFTAGESTNIWSMNRHILCTPFAIIFMIWLFKLDDESLVETLTVCSVIIFCAFLTRITSYQIQIFYYAGFFLAFIFLRLFPTNKNVLYVVYGVALIVQSFFMDDFLLGKWVG